MTKWKLRRFIAIFFKKQFVTGTVVDWKSAGASNVTTAAIDKHMIIKWKGNRSNTALDLRAELKCFGQ